MGRLTVVHYAINGRGMGHLVRQLAIARWIRRLTGLSEHRVESWVLTSSEADTLCRREGLPSLKMPSKAMFRDAGMDPHRYLAVARGWVLQTVASLQPDLLVVDTFPGGSFGELVPVLELARRKVLVARRVKEGFAEQDTYQALLPLYDHLVVPDDSDTGPCLLRERTEVMAPDAARAALGIAPGRRAVYVTLGGGGEASASTTLPRLVDQLHSRGWHVVVGAGPLYQGPERRGPGLTWLTRYAPAELLPGVDAAVAAAGYNTFHELMHLGVPTVFWPLARIADDQRERAMRAVEAGAGRLAERVEDIPALLEDPGSAEAARALVPGGGARRAARACLEGLVDPSALDLGERLLTPSLLAVLQRLDGAEQPRRALELVKLLGGTPQAQARERALALRLRDQGQPVEVPDEVDPAVGVRRFIEAVDRLEIPIDTATSLLSGLARKFPAARGTPLADSAVALFTACAPFDDWMGLVSLLRSVPTQRTYPLAHFVRDLSRWLVTHDDLFDALRELSRLENHGERTIAECLHLLTEPR